jgi:molybdopterin adenylyltransferase
MDQRSRAAVITVSDGVANGTRVDGSGDLAAQMLAEAGFEVATRLVVADEGPEIEAAIRDAAATHILVITTGGTGFGPRDVTPEATLAVLERQAPGLAELIRAAGLTHTPMAALSRGVAGTIGPSLIVNLPGSPKAVREGLEASMAVIPHAVELADGVRGPHPPDQPDGDSWVDATAVKVIGAPPCEVGSSMRIVPGGQVRGTLGCAEFDAGAVEAAAEVAASRSPQTRVLHHDLGDIEVYFEPHGPAHTLVVVSATDVARALRRFLRPLGFEGPLVEPRADRVAPDDGSWRASFDGVALGPDVSVVFTDHDAPGVTEMLATLLRSPAGFIGVMGSRRHVAHYVSELEALGFTDVDLARIRSPLGIDIGGRSPEAIALSIAAGVVANANGRDGGWLDRN